jgi:hypothetical protein
MESPVMYLLAIAVARENNLSSVKQFFKGEFCQVLKIQRGGSGDSFESAEPADTLLEE